MSMVSDVDCTVIYSSDINHERHKHGPNNTNLFNRKSNFIDNILAAEVSLHPKFNMNSVCVL